MIELIKAHPLFFLVANGFKTAASIGLPHLDYKKNAAILNSLRKDFPHMFIYFHPLNLSFIEFYHKDLLKKKMKKLYPQFLDLDPEQIIINRRDHFIENKEYQRFYGRVFDYPDSCIQDFYDTDGNNDLSMKFVSGLNGQVSLAWKTKKAQSDGKKYIKYLEKCLA